MSNAQIVILAVAIWFFVVAPLTALAVGRFIDAGKGPR